MRTGHSISRSRNQGSTLVVVVFSIAAVLVALLVLAKMGYLKPSKLEYLKPWRSYLGWGIIGVINVIVWLKFRRHSESIIIFAFLAFFDALIPGIVILDYKFWEYLGFGFLVSALVTGINSCVEWAQWAQSSYQKIIALSCIFGAAGLGLAGYFYWNVGLWSSLGLGIGGLVGGAILGAIYPATLGGLLIWLVVAVFF